MMKSKLLVMMSAMMAVFALSSCLGENDPVDYPDYERLVTVGAGASKLYSDNDEILIPVNSVTGLDKVERAIVSFDLVPAELNGTKLEAGKTYQVEINSNYCYGIPTSNVIDLNNNPVAVDSLVNTQDAMMNVENLYVKNGYLTASLTYSVREYSPCYLDLAYDSETDIDLTTNTITFTLYYDNRKSTPNTQIVYPYSFRLPVNAYYKFKDASTINVVLRYMAQYGDYREQKCTMSKEDFILSM